MRRNDFYPVASGVSRPESFPSSLFHVPSARMMKSLEAVALCSVAGVKVPYAITGDSEGTAEMEGNMAGAGHLGGPQSNR